MLSISCEHPDLEEFIGIKSDLNRITKANISIRLTDEFMKAVESGSEYTLHFTRPATGETIRKTVNAKEIFRKIAEMNWDYAEPGALFWDNICNHNLLSETKEFEFAGTNPCLSGDTLIQTVDGLKQIKDLVGESPFIYCMNNEGSLDICQADKVWMTRRSAQTVTVKTSRGSIKCTPDHRIFTTNKGWVLAKDLVRGDKIKGLNRCMKDESHVAVALSGGKYIPEHRFVMGHFQDILNKDVHHIDGDTLNNSISNLSVLAHAEHSVISNTGRKIENLRDEEGRFAEKPEKKKRASFNQGKPVGVNWFVQSVEWNYDTEDVYDMSVPDVHNFIANDMVVHNCAEEPLPAGGSCLLGSLNLVEFISADGKEFDTCSFEKAICTAVKALNDLLDEGLPLHPLQEQRDSVRDWRQIGLGVMGIADMLIKMGLRYDSSQARDLCGNISCLLAETAIRQSAELAKQYGQYPKCNAEEVMSTGFFKDHWWEGIDYESILKYGLRNSQLLTIAPTGTLSTMLGISGGIEPIFANYYERKTESLHGKDVSYKVYTPIVERYMKEHGITDDKDLPDFFVTAQTINYKDRIAMQATWQKHIDASISSTVNVPNSFTIEEAEDLYLEAWRKGLKGITIFRDGCKRAGVLTITPSKEEPKELTRDLQWGDIIQVSDDVVGKKRKLTTGCGSLHCTAFFDPITGNLMETYLSKGSTGGCAQFMTGLSRTVSLAARAGCDIHTIVDQLNSCGVCPSYAVRSATKKDTSKGACCPIAVGNALLDMWKETQEELGLSEEEEVTSIVVEKRKGDCPQCGGNLVHEGGCDTCKICGWSKCN
jgi:ribonucleotide reductase alpha subunit